MLRRSLTILAAFGVILALSTPSFAGLIMEYIAKDPIVSIDTVKVEKEDYSF